MKHTLALVLMVFGSFGKVQAEVAYNSKNPEHKLDNYCVGVISFARDLFFGDVLMVDGKVWMKTIEPSKDVQKARFDLTDLSNTFILKYEYSREFNNNYRAQARLVKQRAMDEENENEHGAEFLKKELEMCKGRV